jgi:SOS response regulatory protein OraA/RecX
VPAKTDVIEYALKYIYRYQKTEKELIIQLRKKKYTETEIQKAIKYLKER